MNKQSPESISDRWWLGANVSIDEFLSDIDSILTSSSGSGERGDKKVFELEFVLTSVASAIRNYGWLGVAKAEEYGRAATAHIVNEWLYESEPKNGYIKPKVKVTVEDVSSAIAAIEWARDLSIRNSNYLQNIHLIAVDGYGTFKEFNMAASILASHSRATEDESQRLEKIRAEAAKPISEYVGTVGEKVAVNATLVVVKGIESMYGLTTLTKWETEAGEVLTWFASSNPELDRDSMDVPASLEYLRR